MKKFTVEADRKTGEWLEEPRCDSDVVKSEWDQKKDTADVHFDTFEKIVDFSTNSDDGKETCAIEVVWVD